jgi:four helix bundle protein
MRAASSIVLNIAEGAGEFPAREKARIYRIARRSAAETSAALDLLVASGLAREQDANPIQERLFEIGAMLTGLIKAQALRSPSKPSSRP